MMLSEQDLEAMERLLMHGVTGTNPLDWSGATMDDVSEAAFRLFAEVRRLRDGIEDTIGDLEKYAHDTKPSTLVLPFGVVKAFFGRLLDEGADDVE